MSHLCNRILVIFLAILTIVPGYASDKAKEKRWADQIVDFVMVGEPVWLDTGKEKFLGLYAEAIGKKPKGAALILHGFGVHPDWTDVVNPLRSQLPEQGWATLSIQLPILPNEATYHDYGPLFDEVAPRLNTAFNYLRKKGYKDMVIIAHSLGTDMTAFVLSQDARLTKNTKAFVAISMSAPFKKPLPGKATIDSLKVIAVPMLDLYGADDKGTIAGAKARKKAGSSKGRYDQKAIKGADHFFRGRNDILINTVSAWIEPFGKK